MIDLSRYLLNEWEADLDANFGGETINWQRCLLVANASLALLVDVQVCANK